MPCAIVLHLFACRDIALGREAQGLRRDMDGQPRLAVHSFTNRYCASAALAFACISRFSSAGVSVGLSMLIVSLSIVPVNLNGT